MSRPSLRLVPQPTPRVFALVAALPGYCAVCDGRPLRLTRVISGRATGPARCPLCRPEPGRSPIPAVFGIPFRTDTPRGDCA